MQISYLIALLKSKISANGIIKILLLSIISIWLSAYLYLLSNKSSGKFFDYNAELFEKQEILRQQVESKACPYSPELVPVYQKLCQISLCRNDLLRARNYIAALINCSHSISNTVERANIYLFTANLFRDFADFDQARIEYEKALLLINTTPDSDLKKADLQVFKARVLNNLGTTYLLLGKTESDRSRSLADYTLAKEYFAKASEIITGKDNCFSKTIKTNVYTCLTEMNFSH